MNAKNNPLLVRTRENKGDTSMTHRTYFDRIFDDAFSIFDDGLFGGRIGMRSSDNFSLGINSQVQEDKSMAVSVDVPGLKAEDITIEVSNQAINITGERKTNNSSVRIHKSFSIPEGYSEDNIVANLQDGVLGLILVPKSLPAREVKKITIGTPSLPTPPLDK